MTANLPEKAFAETARFYGRLGFAVGFQDEGWMILSWGDLEIEFFPHPDLSPPSSWFSACVRVADVDALHRAWSQTALRDQGIPRLTAPRDEDGGLRTFALVDPNGSLLRCMAPLPAPDAPR